MSVLAARKCERHSAREAVARCPSCEDHFCRECVVEHEGQLLCAPCLGRLNLDGDDNKQSRWVFVTRFGRLAFAMLVLWIAFYAFGQFLKTVPPAVHDGTLWRLGD